MGEGTSAHSTRRASGYGFAQARGEGAAEIVGHIRRRCGGDGGGG